MYPTHRFTPVRLAGLLLALLLLLVLSPATPAAHAGDPIEPAQARHYRADETPPGLSVTGWQQITDQLEQQQYAPAATAQPGHFQAFNPALSWRLTFAPTGLNVQPAEGDWRWGLHLQAYGRAGAMRSVERASLSAEGQTVTYRWDNSLRELFHNRSDGLKQDFVLQQRPTGSGSLRLAIATPGSLSAHLSNDGSINFYDSHNQLVLTYAGLHVFDAAGQPIPAHFELTDPTRQTPYPSDPQSKIQNPKSKILTIVIDDTTARYPLTVDPIAQQAYLKASNTGAGDNFGWSVALSGDTVVVGAYQEDSNANGVNGDQTNNSVFDAGAAYVFTRPSGGTTWSQQAYLKASNPEVGDQFGSSVALSGDTVVVGAYTEDSNASGVNGDQTNNSALGAGAAYVFTRPSGGTTWSQQAYLKASNPETNDFFGISVALSGDTVVVGANQEDSNASGVNGDQTNNSALGAGAVYVFTRPSGGTTWSQQAYLKASNTGASDQFGTSVALSGDTVVVGANQEDSNASGVNGDQTNNSAPDAGAAYVFTRPSGGTTWSQQAYLKASNTGASDWFGYSVALSGDTVVVGAFIEASNASGVNGDQTNNSALGAGAAYVFTRPSGGTTWSQQAYLKASNPAVFDQFGISVAISGDTVVVGANGEASNASGVNGDQTNNSASYAGAVYVFTRPSGGTTWSQQAYLKASNPEASDQFGTSVALSGDTVVVGAIDEDSNASGVNGDQTNNSASGAGAAYVFLDVPPPSEMAVLGNGLVITDGDATPSPTDDTDFGSTSLGGAITRTFTISNSGPGGLSLTGTPVVSLTGAAASDFSVVSLPATPVIFNTSTTFQVRFDSTVTGTRAATVTIANNDSDENPYDFAIQGVGSNTAPIANAGTGQNVNVGTLVTLDGSGSSDPDGHTPLTYGWSQSGGPAVTLSSATAVSPTFTASATPAVLTFTLRVTDSFGLPDPTPDEVVVTVSDSTITGLTAANSSPTHLGNATSFTATISGGSNVSYAWAFGNGQTGLGTNPSHTYGATGSYTAVVTATNATTTVTATTSVNITNQPPAANAGSNQTVNTSAVVTLNGTANSDPDNDLPLTYGWSQTGGSPAVTLSNATAVSPTFTAPATPTVLTFSLTVTDSFGLTDPTPATVVVTVAANLPEIAVLGNGVTIAAGDTTPTPADDTDFGSVSLGGAITRTFTISNSGTGSLSLTGSPLVSINGAASGNFSVVSLPATTVAAGNTTSFQMRFSPSVTGTRTAILTIANNDSNENPYNFAIRGIGVPFSTYLPLILN